MAEITKATRDPKQRAAVFFQTTGSILAAIHESPGEWFLVGGGEMTRRNVFASTAWRIKNGTLGGFANPPDAGGHYEAAVTSGLGSIQEREYPVELYVRYCQK